MTKQEKIYFDELRKDRLENAKVLSKQSMRGVTVSVIEKYTDQAHFIYELLQNADDAKATRAEFFLFKDRLIFRHNGTRHFTITDPANEIADSRRNRLGDVNAITSIGNSNKTAATIGKFGIGFKAVFQYTSTPQIYDFKFSFCIKNFIVPNLLPAPAYLSKIKELRSLGITDHADKTIFEFPFDKSNCPPERAFREIGEKIKALTYPLLFLSNLKELTFMDMETRQKISYSKNIEQRQDFQETTAELILLTQNAAEERLWLFSKIHDGFKYSVGFFLDDARRLKPVKQRAFCFFLTKKDTGLNFIVHAPFLLTDSREGILAGNQHNKDMINLLAVLAAESLNCLRDMNLIDDGILDIIPINKNEAAFNVDERDEISFRPFYDKIKEAMQTAEILPSGNGAGYARLQNAYWAEFARMTEIFSNAQLAEITGNAAAKWVFTRRSRGGLFAGQFEYISEIVKDTVNEEVILGGRQDFYSQMEGRTFTGVTPEFIERQSIDWLHKFYKWISLSKNKIAIVKERAFFIDQDYKSAKASKLFLPTEDDSGYRTIHPQLLNNPETEKFLVEDIGLRAPSLKDEIYEKILPQYEKGTRIKNSDNGVYFKKIFLYYENECPAGEAEDFLKRVKECICLLPKFRDGYCYKPNILYLPTPYLMEYFRGVEAVKFVDFNFYLRTVGENYESALKEFLKKIDVADEIRYVTGNIDEATAIARKLPVSPPKRYERKWVETNLDSCSEILEHIVKNRDAAKSFVLWRILLVLHQKTDLYENLFGFHSYKRKENQITPRKDIFDSTNLVELRSVKWLVDKHGNFKSAAEILLADMADEYDTTSANARPFIELLQIANNDALSHLSPEEQQAVNFYKQLKAANFSDADIQSIVHEQVAKKTAATPTKPKESSPSEPSRGPLKPRKSTPRKFVPPAKTAPPPDIPAEIVDEDEYTPAAVDYDKKLERAQAKSEMEQAEITSLADLQEKAAAAPKYSYGWFKTLLEMEILNSNEKNLNSREVSINFSKVELEKNSARTLILKHPSRYIPQFMEDLENIPLELHTVNDVKRLEIEVVSVKYDTLRAKLKPDSDIADFDFSGVKEASIKAKNPVFLLHELQYQFNSLKFDDDFNMQENLCANIEFIFGPPGTGKTYYLAEEIIRLIKNSEGGKILVLTPTNKAADVLAAKILDKDAGCADWLIRFGTTDDERLERDGIFREKTFDILNLKQSVTVTTIARFPYDFFMPPNKRLFLRDLNWDYIIIDEASMIPLVSILLPLYKKTPKKFIIAGDPFQIEPVIAVNLWKGENIYTLVNLNSFADTKTTPHDYPVKRLEIQYRSIPEIGEVFSRFAYSGILNHHRNSAAQRPLHLDNWLEIRALNIIKFPVKKYESIYRCKRLNNSPYQIYSALFSFEFVRMLSRKIAENNSNENFKIGVIAPYRAQAEIISKLFAAAAMPASVAVQVGTIHGFQGDECDIIAAVFNPPPFISASDEMFLNKLNIINVAISRARDYLFILMPDARTAQVENLIRVNEVENIFYEEGCDGEFSAGEVESLLFANPNYIENFSFATGHQNVNVYSKPAGKYEIRSEDAAVDVQIHEQL